MRQFILDISKEIHKLDKKAKIIMLAGLQFACGLLVWSLMFYFISGAAMNFEMLDFGKAMTETAVIIAAEALIFGFVADMVIKKHQ